MLVLIAAGVPAAERAPRPGDHVFNWLVPDASCAKLTSKDVASFASCEAQENAFGIEVDAQACRVSDAVEIMVYPNPAQCRQALEAMQANGP